MKYILYTSMFIVVIALTLLVSYISSSDKIYVTNYFQQIGITSFNYSDVLEAIGFPEREVVEQVDDYDWLTLYYEKYELIFTKKNIKSKERYFLRGVRIVSSETKFGKYKIGVGSTKKEVLKAYKGFKKILEVDCGFLDGRTWVEFEFDNEDKVKNMLIYYGP